MYPVVLFVRNVDKVYSQLIKLSLINCSHIGLGIGLQTVIVVFGLRPQPNMTVLSPIPRPI